MIKKKTTREIYDQNRKNNAPLLMSNLVVWLHNIRSMHNVGSALRTADAFTIRSVFLSGYTPAPPRPEISKTALGAENSVDWKHSENPDVFLEWCRNNNYILAGVEQVHGSRPLTEYRTNEDARICLLFGNEVTGIDPDLLVCCDPVLEIPQFGKKHSLNISVSLGIVCYHFLCNSFPYLPK